MNTPPVPDTIERELILPVPPNRVWEALTRPEQLSAWFGTHASLDLRPGGALSFSWDQLELHGTNSGVIEVVEPPHRFAWRWRSGPHDEPMTRVEFTLEVHPQGTRLRMVESGFASLRAVRHSGNTQGWERELADLVAYIATDEHRS
jgi:uncharacterized protein YndB with AHSA1/START domain